ncbi:hypothetical protein M2142_000642 [Fusobacterium sp. PH5-29]|uniref:hypothetical protein n=1 Tax=Fusobacterium sp. PH5-29 TaxID=1742400 RepID=UPI003D26303E
MAYSFDNLGNQNIIFEVTDTSIDRVVNWYSKNKDTQKAFEFGFSIKGISSPKKLVTQLKNKVITTTKLMLQMV